MIWYLPKWRDIDYFYLITSFLLDYWNCFKLTRTDSSPNKDTNQTFVLMMTSWRRLEDVFHLRLQNSSSRRLDRDENSRLSLTSSEDVFKTSCQDVLKTSSRRLEKCLQDIFKTSSRRFEDVFKTSCKDISKMFSRRMIKLNCSC